MKARYINYQLNFKFPAVTSGGVFPEKIFFISFVENNELNILI